MKKLIFVIALIFSTSVFSETKYVKRINNSCSIESFEIKNLPIKEDILIENLATLSACINTIELVDFDNDYKQELILYTSTSGGSGIQIKNKTYLDTKDNDLVYIEVPDYYLETASATYVFPREEYETIVNFFNDNNVSQDYIREVKSFYISSDKYIEIYNEMSYSFEAKYLSDKFDRINTNFKKGVCKYYYGKIDLGNTIKLNLSDNEKELCDIKK